MVCVVSLLGNRLALGAALAVRLVWCVTASPLLPDMDATRFVSAKGRGADRSGVWSEQQGQTRIVILLSAFCNVFVMLL